MAPATKAKEVEGSAYAGIRKRVALLGSLLSAFVMASGCAATPEERREWAAREDELAALRLRLTRAVSDDREAQARVERIACVVDASTCRSLEIFVLRDNWPRADMTGRILRISAGMLSVAGNDDAVAFVVGHEIAHARLRHAPVEDHRRATALEIEADTLGMELAVAAGYAPRAGADLLRRILVRARAALRPNKQAIRQLEKRRLALERVVGRPAVARPVNAKPL